MSKRAAAQFKRDSLRIFKQKTVNSVDVEISWKVSTPTPGHDPQDRFSTPEVTDSFSETVIALRHNPSPERSSFIQASGIRSGDILLDFHPNLLPFDPLDATITSIEFNVDGRDYVAESNAGRPTFTPDAYIGGFPTLYTVHLRLKGSGTLN